MVYLCIFGNIVNTLIDVIIYNETYTYEELAGEEQCKNFELKKIKFFTFNHGRYKYYFK